MSLKAPIRGAERNDKKPLMPWMMPLISRVSAPNVLLSWLRVGVVRRPQAKNSRKRMMTG